MTVRLETQVAVNESLVAAEVLSSMMKVVQFSSCNKHIIHETSYISQQLFMSYQPIVHHIT